MDKGLPTMQRSVADYRSGQEVRVSAGGVPDQTVQQPADREPTAVATPPGVPPVALAPVTDTSATSPRGVTVKAVLAGLLGVAVISLYTSTNDRVLKLSPLIGNHLPVGPLTYILALAALWNPVVGRITRALRFGTRELAVVLGMMLICSWIPSSSLYRYLQDYMVLPWSHEAAHPNWKANGTLSYIPPSLTPLEHDAGTDPQRYPPGSEAEEQAKKAYDRVYNQFTLGNDRMTLREVPYRAWLPAIERWWILALSMAVALIALMWLVHRQWAHHEQLSYPIASVTTALIERTGGRLTSDIFYQRLFWGGFVPVFLLHLLNYLAAWFPNYVPNIMLSLWSFSSHSAIKSLWHVTDYTAQWWLFFAVVGLAYFIPSEISLSMGISTIVITLVGLMYYFVVGTAPSGDNTNSTLAGAYLAYFGIMLYTGRTYLWGVSRRALGLVHPQTPVEREQVLAARLFLIAFAAFVTGLITIGHLDPLIAILFGTALMIYFLVFARVVAETGVPFLQAPWDPGVLLCQLLGFPAVGPANLILVQYIGAALNPDARECVTPYVANTLKMADNVGVRLPRLILLGVIGTVIALVLSFGSQTYNLYFKGSPNLDAFAFDRPDFVLDNATRGLSTLKDLGLTDIAAQTHGLAKLSLVGKNTGHTQDFLWMAFGIIGVVALSALRFRFLWWPLHPVLFLVWGTWTSMVVWMSFLFGWIVKELIVRYGGGHTYQRLKPLFIGLIMGEIAATTVTLVIGAIYYACTHDSPPTYHVFPG